MIKAIFTGCLLLFCATIVSATPQDLVQTSPKPAWAPYPKGQLNSDYESEATWRHVAYWLPNRLLDFLDIFRLDLGVGPATGAVVRLSKYAQAGVRDMNPASLRIGLMGRRAPIMLEKSNEIGVGPGFNESSQRQICKAEVGLGLDPIIVGIYAGICLDEALDFGVGLFGYDYLGDDL
jgi:hypothetical protein